MIPGIRKNEVRGLAIAAALIGGGVGMSAIPMASAQATAEGSIADAVPEALTLQTLDTWRALIMPDAADNRWREIPWRSSLWQAVLDAQIEGKPLLIWVMNGHPMGCT